MDEMNVEVCEETVVPEPSPKAPESSSSNAAETFMGESAAGFETFVIDADEGERDLKKEGGES